MMGASSVATSRPSRLSSTIRFGAGGRDLAVLLLGGIVERVAVHAVAGGHVEQVADDQGRSVRRIAGKYAQFLPHVERPHDSGVAGLRPRTGRIQAKHLEAVGNEIDAVPFDRRRRANPDLLRNRSDADRKAVDLVGHLAGRGLPLPKALAAGGVEADEDAQGFVQAADVDLSTRHRRGGIEGSAQFHPPFHVGRRGRVDRPVAPLLARRERLGQALFLRNHVLPIGPAPLGPVRGRHARHGSRAEKKDQCDRTANVNSGNVMPAHGVYLPLECLIDHIAKANRNTTFQPRQPFCEANFPVSGWSLIAIFFSVV